VLTRAGHDVLLAADGNEALAQAGEGGLDLVLCDIKMPGCSGIEVVESLAKNHPDLPCIVVTGYGSAAQSLDALRVGAFWYLEKPFDGASLDVVRCLVDQAIEHGRLRAENRHLHRELRTRHAFGSVVGASASFRRVLDTVAKVAETDSTVLITGESGTGKELVAKAIHYNSARCNRMLVTVNCGAIPEELLESELFGHTKGAFTNAVKQRTGRFAVADGGTIFLDEIGDMSPNLQVKLLRVLQERTFEPVGSSKTVSVDVRVIAATHQNLEEAIRNKTFREDLFYRLNVIPVEVPPLRQRREDVPLLVQHFLDKVQEETGRTLKGFSDDAFATLAAYHWPGNVRELENLVERLTVMREGYQVEVSDLPSSLRKAPEMSAAPQIRLPAEGITFQDLVGDYERDLILQALERTHWNKNRAAKLLGMNRTTLIEKIKRRQIEAPA
jgi:DNA-binding NtrC family response regulator